MAPGAPFGRRGEGAMAGGKAEGKKTTPEKAKKETKESKDKEKESKDKEPKSKKTGAGGGGSERGSEKGSDKAGDEECETYRSPADLPLADWVKKVEKMGARGILKEFEALKKETPDPGTPGGGRRRDHRGEGLRGHHQRLLEHGLGAEGPGGGDALSAGGAGQVQVLRVLARHAQGALHPRRRGRDQQALRGEEDGRPGHRGQPAQPPEEGREEDAGGGPLPPQDLAGPEVPGQVRPALRVHGEAGRGVQAPGHQERGGGGGADGGALLGGARAVGDAGGSGGGQGADGQGGRPRRPPHRPPPPPPAQRGRPDPSPVLVHLRGHPPPDPGLLPRPPPRLLQPQQLRLRSQHSPRSPLNHPALIISTHRLSQTSSQLSSYITSTASISLHEE